MTGFIKLMRNSDVMELIIKKPLDFHLLTIIAYRAKRKDCKITGLKKGSALVGDYENYGMSRQNYRTSLSNLQGYGYITINPTTRGTIATLIDSSIYDINMDDSNHQPNHQVTNEVTISQPSSNHQVTTNKKERSKEVKKKEEKKKIEKENLSEYLMRIVTEEGILSERLFYLLDDFIKMRKELKKPFKTKKGMDGVLRNLKKLSTDEQRCAMIQHSIDNEYQGLFPEHILKVKVNSHYQKNIERHQDRKDYSGKKRAGGIEPIGDTIKSLSGGF